MELDIKNKIAIVTGASKGMGLATVKALLNHGVKVMMVSRDEDKLVELNKQFNETGYIAEYYAGDVANSDLAERVVSYTLEKWGNIHILVNNAGGPPKGSFLNHSQDVWDLSLQTNLLSVVRFSSIVSPIMKKNNWGRIVSITSTVWKEPTPAMVLSATSRAGVTAFTKAISKELAENNITVNTICPGGVKTDRLKDLIKLRAEKENKTIDTLMKTIEQGIPAKRFADPDEIADIILFIVSEKGSYINGVNLPIDGSLLNSI